MKCPRCGKTMTLDDHRKLPLMMCYNCGYIDGRSTDNHFVKTETKNFDHLKKLNFNETVAFLAKGLKIDPETLEEFLNSPLKK